MLELKSVQKGLNLIALFVFMGLLSIAVSAQKVTLTVTCEQNVEKPEDNNKQKRKKGKNSKQSSPRLEINRTRQPATQDINGSSRSSAVLLLGCPAISRVNVTGGPPNQTVIFTITQSNPNNILSFKWNLNDPDAFTIQVPVPLDSIGSGSSSWFHIKSLMVGETIATAESPGLPSDAIYYSVQECNCPSISPDLPPRN